MEGEHDVPAPDPCPIVCFGFYLTWSKAVCAPMAETCRNYILTGV